MNQSDFVERNSSSSGGGGGDSTVTKYCKDGTIQLELGDTVICEGANNVVNLPDIPEGMVSFNNIRIYNKSKCNIKVVAQRPMNIAVLTGFGDYDGRYEYVGKDARGQACYRLEDPTDPGYFYWAWFADDWDEAEEGIVNDAFVISLDTYQTLEEAIDGTDAAYISNVMGYNKSLTEVSDWTKLDSAWSEGSLESDWTITLDTVIEGDTYSDKLINYKAYIIQQDSVQDYSITEEQEWSTPLKINTTPAFNIVGVTDESPYVHCVRWLQGRFVSLPYYTGLAKVSSSLDGLTWQEHTPEFAMEPTDVIYAQGYYVAVSEQGVISRTVDLDTAWEEMYNNSDKHFISIAFKDGAFLAEDRTYNGTSVSSIDLVTWTDMSYTGSSIKSGLIDVPAMDRYIYGLGAENGILSLNNNYVKGLGSLIIECFDRQYSGAGVYGGVYGNNRIVAYSSQSVAVFLNIGLTTIFDNIPLYRVNPFPDYDLRGVTFIQGQFILLMEKGGKVHLATSVDGLSWVKHDLFVNWLDYHYITTNGVNRILITGQGQRDKLTLDIHLPAS